MTGGTEESLTPEEERLLRWLESDSWKNGHPPPPDLASHFGRLPELLSCLKGLDALAPPNVPSSNNAEVESPSSIRSLPREFGPYILEEELGRGGMGVVYRARHRTLDALVALKVIRTSEFASEEELRRFAREAKAAAKLRHPGVVNVHDAGEVDGLPFLAMQYIPGVSLAQRLKQRPATLTETVGWMLAVARAVDSLHQNQIVHRDLKPGNILIDGEGRPYVTDFGLAKLFIADGDQTATGTVLGTPAYMSPEQAWGRADAVGAASDLYSLGAVFYELLTGRPPFPESNPLDQLLRLRDADPRPPRRLEPEVPIELEQICLRCLEKRPENRYESAGKLADDLERYQRGDPIALEPIGFWNGLRRWVRREPVLVSHLAGFAVVAIIVQAAEAFTDRMRPSYLPVMGVLALWTVIAVVLQKQLLRGQHIARYLWVATDAVFFTVAVAYAEGPVESLIVGYSMLIAASGLWYERPLVLLMTGVSILSYLALLGIRGEPGPAHYPFIVVGMLAVVGGIVASLVRRIRQLLCLQTGG